MKRYNLINDPHVVHKTNGVSTLMRSRMRVDYENDDYDGTFFDFLEMFIQYGQITLFMSVFPIGGVLAFINNIFEQRGDAFKMLYSLNPQKPNHSDSIDESYQIVDVWITAFNCISYLAVATNVALLAVPTAVSSADSSADASTTGSSSVFVSKLNIFDSKVDTWEETILILFAAEHIMFVLKAWLGYLLTHEDVEQTTIHPQKHFSDAALNKYALTSLLSTNGVEGSAEQRIRYNLKDVLDKKVVEGCCNIVKEMDYRIEMSEKQRDEAIAYAGEVVSSDIIEAHYKKSLTPLKKKN